MAKDSENRGQKDVEVTTRKVRRVISTNTESKFKAGMITSHDLGNDVKLKRPADGGTNGRD